MSVDDSQLDPAQSRSPAALQAAFGQALDHHQHGRLTDAERLYRSVLLGDPTHFDAAHLLGLVFLRQGKAELAEQQLRGAIAIRSDIAAGHASLGNALAMLKRFEESLVCYERAIALDPNDADALCNYGIVLRDLRRFDEALACFDKAVALQPDHAEANYNRGLVLQDLKRVGEALASYDRAIALRPDYVKAHHSRGLVLYELKRFSEALASFNRIIALTPDRADVYNSRGKVLIALNRNEEALASFSRAIALTPDDTEALRAQGHLCLLLNRMDQSFAAYDRAFAINPNEPFLGGIRLYAKLARCDWRNLEPECSHLVAAISNGVPASAPFEFLLTPSSAAEQLQCSKLSASQLHRTPRPLPRYTHDRIRVAYLSADFHAHPIVDLSAGLFERHDRERFEIVGVSWGPDDGSDSRRRTVKAFEHFWDVRGNSDEEVAARIRQYEIDIAVDLKGYTETACPSILASRPAPVQAQYLGYPGTMGADFIDYVIADRIVIPPEHHRHYTEKVVYLPDSYQINDDKRAIADGAALRKNTNLPAGAFVFCSFNNSFKTMPEIFDVWMRLLRAVEGSVLWLLEANPDATINLRREAEQRGVAGERLVFAPRIKAELHRGRYMLADLFLDTLPYNAHTTASEALWAGLPIVTCLGATFAGRVAASLLQAIGLPELITSSLADYEALALALARDPARLSAAKAKVASHRDKYPLFNTALTTRHIETAYRTMWERHQRDEPPMSFEVASAN